MDQSPSLSPSLFERIPAELIFVVLGFLPVRDVLKFREVCKLADRIFWSLPRSFRCLEPLCHPSLMYEPSETLKNRESIRAMKDLPLITEFLTTRRMIFPTQKHILDGEAGVNDLLFCCAQRKGFLPTIICQGYSYEDVPRTTLMEVARKAVDTNNKNALLWSMSLNGDIIHQILEYVIDSNNVWMFDMFTIFDMALKRQIGIFHLSDAIKCINEGKIEIAESMLRSRIFDHTDKLDLATYAVYQKFLPAIPPAIVPTITVNGLSNLLDMFPMPPHINQRAINHIKAATRYFACQYDDQSILDILNKMCAPFLPRYDKYVFGAVASMLAGFIDNIVAGQPILDFVNRIANASSPNGRRLVNKAICMMKSPHNIVELAQVLGPPTIGDDVIYLLVAMLGRMSPVDYTITWLNMNKAVFLDPENNRKVLRVLHYVDSRMPQHVPQHVVDWFVANNKMNALPWILHQRISQSLVKQRN